MCTWGTATGAGLRAALEDLRAAGTGGKGRPPSAIVLLSDGTATDGEAAFAAAQEARRLGIPIYTVALGTADGVIDALSRLAKAVGARPERYAAYLRIGAESRRGAR